MPQYQRDTAALCNHGIGSVNVNLPADNI